MSKNYDLTLLDSPAGLEHFARKTGRDVTDLVIVSDASKMGIHTMKRILEIIDELTLKFNNEDISKINITGGNLIDLPRENRSYQEAKEIFAKII